MPDITEYRGIRGLVACELLSDTEEGLVYDDEIFPVAGVSELTKTTASSSDTHYYNNLPAVVITSTGADEVKCSTSAIELETLARLTGHDYDKPTDTLIEGEPVAKYYAIGYVTQDTNGNEVYVWRYKTKCSMPEFKHNTINNGTDANGQELTFTSINTNYKFTTTGKTAKAINHKAGSLITESAFFAEVMDIDKLKALVTTPSEPSETTEEPTTP